MLFANKQQDWRQVLVKQLTVKFTICGNSEQDISYLGLAMAHAWKNLDLFEDVHQNVVGGKDMAIRSYNSLQSNFSFSYSFPLFFVLLSQG